MYKILALAVLILDVVAVMDILGSRRKSDEKILWILAVIFLPILGPVLYLSVSRRM